MDVILTFKSSLFDAFSFLKFCPKIIPDAALPLALIQALQCSFDWCCAIFIRIALHSREPHKQCCLSALNTKLLISLLPSSPVKRAREDHEARGSGTEPQKKRQKEERKTEQDGSSPSAHFHRLKTTHTGFLFVRLIRLRNCDWLWRKCVCIQPKLLHQIQFTQQQLKQSTASKQWAKILQLVLKATVCWDLIGRDTNTALFHLLLGVYVRLFYESCQLVTTFWLLSAFQSPWPYCLPYCSLSTFSSVLIWLFVSFSPSEPSVMDRLIALEKLMMSCQDKDRLGMLNDVAQSRKEIQVKTHTYIKTWVYPPGWLKHQGGKTWNPIYTDPSTLLHGYLIVFFFFCLRRSWKRSRGSLRARPCCSVAYLEKSPVPNMSLLSRTTRLLCKENRQLPQNPISSRPWSNPYKVSQKQ